jgi:hypothetical protein
VSDNELGFTVGTTVSSDIQARFGVHLTTQEKVYLGKINGPTVDVQVGEIPVPSKVVFTAYAVLNTDGSVGIEYYANYEHTLAATCEIATGGGGTSGCSPVDQDDSQDGGLEAGATVYAAMQVSAGIQLGVSLQIAFLAGPEVTLTPELQFTADTTANPWWSLDLLGELGVAVTTGQAWGEGKSLYENDDLITFGPLNLANAGGPLNSLVISPSQAQLAQGSTEQFQATSILSGVSTTPPATWSVVAGPGTISSSGVYTAAANGVAVIEATYNDMTARASVIVGPAVESDSDGTLDGDTKGLVDAAVASWSPPAVPPTEYAVTATPDDPSSEATAEVVYAPASATHAYLGGLLPDEGYTLTVYAVGAGGGVIGSQPGVIPLDPLPQVQAGSGSLKDIAVNATTGKPDDTGAAGEYWGASVSGNGEYAFFFTEARSNIAPASIYDPASSDVYLLRENLLSGAMSVASVGLDGVTPAPSDGTFGGDFIDDVPVAGEEPVTNTDGSAVAYALDSGMVVHDFGSESTWAVGSAADYAPYVNGLSTNGTVVAYEASDSGNDGGSHVFRQVAGGTPQQVDNCPAPGDATCAEAISGPSMSDDGNLITYQGLGWQDNGEMIYVYNAATGQDSAAFPTEICLFFGIPYSCYYYQDGVISGDGSTIAANESGGDLDQLITAGIGGGDSVAVPNSGSDIPIALDYNGDALMYGSPEAGNDNYNTLSIYQNGESQTAPELAYTSLESGSITSDGSMVVYTLNGVNPATGYTYDYPGVYAWQP